MPKVLNVTRAGNPVLRTIAKRLMTQEIGSKPIQKLIADIRYTLDQQQFGVGLSASQVGEPVALSVIGIKPTPNRPHLEPFDTVLINPEVVATFGKPEPMWEACISCGSGDDRLYVQVPRYKKIKLAWLDEAGNAHAEILQDFVAHVAQHETDHVNGILYLDRVKDPTTYMMADEYRDRVVNKR